MESLQLQRPNDALLDEQNATSAMQIETGEKPMSPSFCSVSDKSPSDESMHSHEANSNNSLLEENETLRKRVKELESTQRLPVANKMAEFDNIMRNESNESLEISMEVAKYLNMYRNKCKEHKATLDNIEKEAVSEPEVQINENDSP